MKPPVVVIGRHCNRNQCGIAVRFKKMHSVAKIAQSSESSASQPTRPTATDLDRRTRRGLPSANELNPQAVPVGCLFRNMKQPVPNILSPSSPSCRSDGRNASARVEQHL